MERNSSRMSNIGCKVSATRRSILKKDIGSSVGKENNPLLLKKSFLAKAPTISCAENRGYEENPPKRRLSLGQGELKREDSRSALTNIKVNAKKAPFFVHCDEKNEKKQIEQKETRLDSRRISVSKPGKSQKSNSEHVSKIPVRKPPGLVRSQSLNPLREIVPLKATRSSSADVPSIKSRVPKISQTKITLPAKTITTSVVTRKISKVASKVESKEVQVANASSKPVIGSKRPLSSLRLRTGRESVFKRHVSVTCEVEKNNTTSNSKDIKGKRVSDILEAKSDEESMSTISHPKETQDSGIAEMSRNSRSGGENLESKLDRRGSLQQENVRYLLGSVITPVDGPPPAPLMPVKVLVKKAKEIAAETTRKQLKRQDTIAGESCPIELAYHMEYQYDLLKIEKEREERAPQLSEYFLRRHINAQQRKDIVAYLIHLGVHCRYPSFVIYQTVKLFDIAMDRLSVGIERIQLTALAALWICLKRLEVYRKIPSAATIIALAKEMYVGQEELLMVYERKVLQAVDFNISFSDAFSLLAHYIINCKHQVDIPADTTDLIYKYGGYMIDLTMLDERFCRPPASLVAFVVAELAMVLVQDTMASVLALKTRWRYSSIVTDTQLLDSPEREDVKEVNGLRAAIIRSIRDSGNKRSGYDIVYKKYNRSRYGCISRSLVERAKRLPSLDTVDY